MTKTLGLSLPEALEQVCEQLNLLVKPISDYGDGFTRQEAASRIEAISEMVRNLSEELNCPREIKHVAATRDYVVALCVDGTVWVCTPYNHEYANWLPMPPIPIEGQRSLVEENFGNKKI